MHPRYFVTRSIFVLLCFALVGAGCGKTPPSPASPGEQAPDVAPTSTVSTTLPALAITAEDSFEIWPADVAATTTTIAPIRVKLLQYAPRTRAALFMRFGAATGSLATIDLNQTHRALLPVVWAPVSRDAVGEASALWLSDDAFLALDRTQQLMLDLGLRDAGVTAVIQKKSPQSAAVWKQILSLSEEAEKKSDIQFIAGVEQIAWPLAVNGRAETVPAYRMRNWFGEMVVLRDRDNPMIVQFRFDPKVDAKQLDKASKGYDALVRLLSYHTDTYYSHTVLQPKTK